MAQRAPAAAPYEAVPTAKAEGARVGAPTLAMSWATTVAVWGLALVTIWLALRLWDLPRPAFSVYGYIVLSYLALQVLSAHLEYRRQMRKRRGPWTAGVTVVLPALNEPPDILRESVRSILDQDYGGPIKVVVVDDGSEPESAVERALQGLAVPPGRQLVTVAFGANRGKRHAQYAGFQLAEGDYVVTVDSDTVLASRAINVLVDEMCDPSVGAVTGAARVANRDGLLPRLIDLRYWCAFHQERASQSLFGVTMCMSGVLAIYRRHLIDEVKDRYINQTFGGRPCTFGDDRHLTNLVLWSGFRTKMATDALCWTQCPTRIAKWVSQQLRWSKSFYREALWSLRFVHKRNWYFAYSLLLGGALPLMLLYGFGYGAWHAMNGAWTIVGRYAMLVFAMGLLRSAYALGRTGDPSFLLFPLYSFLHLVCVVPVRVLALFTLTKTGWGTR